MTPDSPTAPKVKVKVDTQNLVITIVEMYRSDNIKVKKLVSHLVGCIIEAYDNRDELIREILSTYTERKTMVNSMVTDMKKRYPQEAKLLSEIFGIFLFGEKL